MKINPPLSHQSAVQYPEQAPMSPVFIYSIAYSQQCIDELEEGYLVLDNLGNERPDWREYWPIRNFLLTHPLQEDAYYGFFSPRFREKTGLSYDQMRSFVASAGNDVDAVTFSPQVDVGAFFPNVFVGGDMADPGFLRASQKFIDRIGLQVSLRDLFMDSRTTVFSNFVVARPSYWREWFAICEKLYAIAESIDLDDTLADELRFQTSYREGVQRKVFVMEGIASLLLTLRPDIRVLAYNPFTLGWSAQLRASLQNGHKRTWRGGKSSKGFAVLKEFGHGHGTLARRPLGGNRTPVAVP